MSSTRPTSPVMTLIDWGLHPGSVPPPFRKAGRGEELKEEIVLSVSSGGILEEAATYRPPVDRIASRPPTCFKVSGPSLDVRPIDQGQPLP